MQKTMYPKHSTQGESMFIVVEGNIGAGKTTFCETLARVRGQDSHRCELLLEPVAKEQFRRLLGLFYTDMSRWAFAFQMYALKERFNQHTWASELVNNNASVVQDRSIYADSCFGAIAHESGHMTADEWSIYQDTFGAMKRFLRYPDVLVYIRVMPEVCKERMDRRKRPEEAGVPLSYLHRLHEEHERFVDEMARFTRVLVIEDSPFGVEAVTDVNTRINDLAAEDRRFMRNYRRI